MSLHLPLDRHYIMGEVKDYTFILIGVMLYAFGVTVFLLPYGLTAGGVAGIASIVYYATGLEVQVTYVFINAALLLVALKVLGIRFCLKTIFGVGCMTLVLWLFQRIIEIPTADGGTELPKLIGDEAFMAAILGSISCGMGLAMISLRPLFTNINPYRWVALLWHATLLLCRRATLFFTIGIV